jgi:hypothetical protein
MYGILTVEDGNELYQIIGEVASINEARELAADYESRASAENDDTFCPPSAFVVWRRNLHGAYTVREALTHDTTAGRLDQIEKMARLVPCNSAILSGIQECRDRLNGKE